MPDTALNNPTVLTTFASTHEAEIAKGHLEAHDIDAFIMKDDAGGMDPQMQLTRGVRLMVRARDVEEAHDVLDGMGALPRSTPTDPEEAAQNEAAAYRIVGWLVILMGGLIVGGSAFFALSAPGPAAVVAFTGLIVLGCGVAVRQRGSSNPSA